MLSSPPKSHTKPEGSSTPVKLAKKVKRQIRRLLPHHVTLPKFNRPPKGATVAVAFSPILDIIHTTISIPPPSSPRSTRSAYSDDNTLVLSGKYIKQAELSSIDERQSSGSSLHRSSQASIQSIRSSVSSSDFSQHQEALCPAQSEADWFSQRMSQLPQSDSEPQLKVNQPLSESTTVDTVYVEPEVPDPFLIDEEGDALSEEDHTESTTSISGSPVTMSGAQDILLTIPASPSLSDPPPTSLLSSNVNVNKDVPPPPASDSEQDEGPNLYISGLVLPTMFLPIPNTDPLTTLLTKYISPPDKRPVRDVTGDWQRGDFHTLVMTNSWRALARMARDRIVSTDPSELVLILGLWHLRLSCLARLRLFNQTSAECTNLFSVLNAIEPREDRQWLFDHVLPFELEVMQCRLKYWAGDHMGYLDSLSSLLRNCRTKSRLAKGDEEMRSMWKERGARICLIIASQMVEMKEYLAATKLLEPLCDQSEDNTSPALRSSIARIYLQSGNISMAAKYFAAVSDDPTATESQKSMNTALLAAAQGDWVRSSEVLREILSHDAENYVAVNNLSVALLSQGKLKEGIDVLEAALRVSPSSVVVAEPFLFNLSTLYELRSAAGVDKKRELLIEVAKWSGDGLKTTCLKMPTT